MAIITTAEYQSYTGTTLTPAQTTYVNSLIPVVQNQIETYLDRLLDAQDYSEWYKYSRHLVLRQYPVNNVKFIGGVDEVANFDSEDYNYEITPTALYVTDNTLTTTTITFGGAITTLTDIKTAVEAALPVVLTINSGYANLSYKLLRVGTGREVMGAKRNDCKTKLIEDENRTLEFIMDAGFVFFTSLDYTSDTNVFVVYNAGYAEASIPQAIKMVAVNSIKDILNIQGFSSEGVISGIYQMESITNYSYALANGAQWKGSMDIASIVSKYYGDLDPFRKKTI